MSAPYSPEAFSGDGAVTSPSGGAAMERDYYVTTDVCRALDISRPTAIRLSEQGEIPGMYRVGRRYRWDKTVFDAHLKRVGPERTKRTK